ncbi:MAG TPA: tetratricopeptide repeat protein [Ardenticatenaceae bacterium]|nr:tetratricopeptide repeat protein [Ardenticatenaceae bacterium]
MSGQPVKRGTMAHDHDVYTLLADAAAQQRDLPALSQYAPRAEELAECDGHPLYLAIAHRALGVAKRLAGDYAEAGARLRQALPLFQQLGTQWQAGRTLAEMADLALAQGDQAGARDSLTQALALFEALRALPDVERTRRALRMVDGAAG